MSRSFFDPVRYRKSQEGASSYHKTYIAALLAGMLVLAGCGGGGSVCNPESDEYQCLGKEAFEEQEQAKDEAGKLQAAVTALTSALKVAESAGENVTDEQIKAITDAHTDLKTELDDATETDETAAQKAYDDAVLRLATVRANKSAGDAKLALETARMGRETAQKGELTSADTALSTALSTALDADDEDVTEDMVTAITDARAALEAALRRAVDVSDEDKAQYQRNVEDSSLKLQTVQAKRQIAIAAEKAEEERNQLANAAKRADAASLKAALDDSSIPGARNAGFVDANKTSDPVDALHGWTGAKHEKKTGSKVTGEGYLYTKLGKVTPGKIFGGSTLASATTPHMYQLKPVAASLLLAPGEIANGYTIGLNDITKNDPAKIRVDGFTATAGSQPFKKPQEDADEANDLIIIPGSYHGVPGDYRCLVGDNGSCHVNFNTKGQTFAVSSASLVFIPDNPNARVTAAEAPKLAEYGWWLDKSKDDWTVDVFAGQASDQDLALGDAVSLPDDGGTAKYVGGAAGKYAFSSLLGDSHEAGHFTAKVTLNAKFGATASARDASARDTISGTVDEFKGDAEGMEGWSVSLGESLIGEHFETSGITSDSDNGEIPGFTGGSTFDGTTTPSTQSEVTWSLSDDDASPATGGEWKGQLWALENGVPTVATGTFRAEYGSDATMVGAFGADKQ